MPTLSPEAALLLELGPDLTEQQELALVTLLAGGLKYIWESRSDKKQVQLYKMRAEAEAWVSRKTTYTIPGDMITDMLQ